MKIKKIVAWVLSKFKVTDFSIKIINKKTKNNYIRVINYHHTLPENILSFKKQLEYFKSNYVNVDYDTFEQFLNNEYSFSEKPGLIITFDDGYDDNYFVAHKMLSDYGFTGWYMISCGLIGENGYMSKSQINQMQSEGAVIGCHTYTHHRMNKTDTEKKLLYEIHEAKYMLEKIIGNNVDIFCWVGGEEEYYTLKAQQIIKTSGYKYSFMTNSYPVYPNNDHYLIQRSNVETEWSIDVLKFQLSPFNDLHFSQKRLRVNKKIEAVN